MFLRLVAISSLLVWGLFFSSYISLSWWLSHEYHRLFVPPAQNESSFDFIVVGAGSAGSIVARRLAEKNHSVLLVEAGGPSHWLMGVPRLHKTFWGSHYDWQYENEVSSKYALAKGSNIKYPRGKVLGGSSMLNIMLNVRGHSGDYDEWANLGNPGWSYEEVLPMFKRSERYEGHVGEDQDRFHGREGPLAFSPTHPGYDLNQITLDAFLELGHEKGNVNGELEDGGFFDPYSIMTVRL